MSQLSDSLTKVSEQMADLSDRARAAEEHAADARTQTREEIEGRISEARADAQRLRREIKARGAESLTTKWYLVADVVDRRA